MLYFVLELFELFFAVAARLMPNARRLLSDTNKIKFPYNFICEHVQMCFKYIWSCPVFDPRSSGPQPLLLTSTLYTYIIIICLPVHYTHT